MKKRTKLFLIGSGVTVLMMALAESTRQAVAQYFVSIALNRDIPPHPIRAEQHLIDSCISEDMLVQIQQAGQRLSAKSHTVIHIQSSDGIQLTGHWMPSQRPKRIVVAMHGWRSSWDNDFGMIADFLLDNECSVLFAEQRGQGKSGGKYMGFGLMERYDCLEWVNWANEQTGGNCPVYLCGISMGASTVLMAGGLDLPPNVRGILADSGYTSAVDIWKHVAKNLHLSYGMCGGPAGRVAKKRLCMAMDAESCPQALARCKVPVLFIHGTDDRFVPIEMTYKNYKACTAQKRLLVVPGAEHGMSYLIDPKGYETAVKNFWADFDQKIPS